MGPPLRPAPARRRRTSPIARRWTLIGRSQLSPSPSPANIFLPNRSQYAIGRTPFHNSNPRIPTRACYSFSQTLKAFFFFFYYIHITCLSTTNPDYFTRIYVSSARDQNSIENSTIGHQYFFNELFKRIFKKNAKLIIFEG